MKAKTVGRILWPSFSILFLSVWAILCRYPLYPLHESGWLFFWLLLCGYAAIGVFAAFDYRRIELCTALGYPTSFFAALLVKNLTDAKGGFPTLWIASFVFFFVAGIIWEIVYRVIRRPI